MNEQSRRWAIWARVAILIVFSVLVSSCPDALSKPEFNNTFDPKNPDSPFAANLSPLLGTGTYNHFDILDTVSVEARWTPIEDAIRYEIQSSTDRGFESPQTVYPESNSTMLENLANGSTVHWRVRFEAWVTPLGETEPILSWSTWHGPWMLELEPIPTEQLGPPQFNPAGGTYSTDQSVEITTETADATIYYTTDGSDPVVGAGETMEYTDPISVAGDGTSLTIRAIAVRSGYTDSTVAEATYTIAYEVETAPATVTVLVEMPEQPTVTFSGQQLSLPYGTTMTVTATTVESPDEPPTWYLDGASATTGETYTTDAALTTGPHAITLVVTVDGIPYTETINFQVVTP